MFFHTTLLNNIVILFVQIVCHGIPDGYVLKEGDIINIDVTAYIGGVHGDCSETFPVGEIDEKSTALIQVCF